jgi:DNA polymerase I
MDFIITKRKDYFGLIGEYDFCTIDDIQLPNVVAVDTETTGLECYHTDKGFRGDELFAIQLGTKINNYLIDLEGGINLQEVFNLLKDKTLVFHNAMFDLRFFFKHNFVPKKVRDTFLASKILYNGGRDDVFTHNFKDVMQRELNLTYDKTEQANIGKNKLSNNEAIKYCFNDVDKLLQLEEVLYQKLEDNNQLKAYEVQCDATLPLAYMEMCGMPLDNIKWLDKIKKNKLELEEVGVNLKSYIYDNLPKYRDNQLDLFVTKKEVRLNFNSPKQMMPVFKDFNLNIINDKGKKSLNEKVISKNKHAFVDIWLSRQKLQKALSTFGENVLEKAVEGRIYTSFNPMVDTSRISCRKGGINFLNFPREKMTRDAFVANKGYKMVGADYSNQEVYCGADMHHDKVTLDSIKKGICLHCAFAKVLYPEIAHLSDKEIKEKHPDKRQEAKSPRFAFQ